MDEKITYDASTGLTITQYKSTSGIRVVKYSLNDKLHRLDGPAITWADGSSWWYVDDSSYATELEYWIAVQKYIDTHHTA